MKVNESFPHPNENLLNHYIQFGISTWTENEAPSEQTESIRRAVYNDGGIFSPHGSSEIPMEDMTLLMRACIERDKIEINELTVLLDEISNSIKRQIL